MNNSYVIESNSVGILNKSYLLLDTNFLIDALIFANEFADLLIKLRSLECELITTRNVIIEYFGGTHSEENYDKKKAFLELMFGKPLEQIISLPIDSKIEKTSIIAYSRQCKKFGSIDYELYLTLKKYSHSKILLISRNHTDFTTAILQRKGFITLLGTKEIRTYGLYAN